jgi:glycosyltransferase involved in cell wall biosynthesis
MDVTEPGRHWAFQPEMWSFPHRVERGLRLYTGEVAWLFNPRLVADVLYRPPRWLLLGGSWQIPTVLCLSIGMRRRSQSSTVLFWNESTAVDLHRVSAKGIGSALKQWAFKQYTGFVVPGQRAAEYVSSLTDSKMILHFPNVVNEQVYRDQVHALRTDEKILRRKYGLAQEEIVFLWPARLVSVKGHRNFLQAIARLNIGKPYAILLAGEGPERPIIEAWQKSTGFANLRFLGHCDNPKMLELYAFADVLLLPSLSEPFGFVIIEALWAGLSVFVSNRAGAWPEAVLNAKNGWVIDPTDPEQIRNAFAEAIMLGRDRLKQMGLLSLSLAHERFDTKTAVRQFVDQLMSFDK